MASSNKTFSVDESVDDVLLHTTCTQYPEDTDVDASWKAARAFSILASIFGITFGIMNIIAMGYNARPDKSKSVIGPEFVLTALFEGLSLLFLNSNACKNNSMVEDWNDNATDNVLHYELEFQGTCRFFFGAICTIVATVLYFAASILSCVARASEK